MALAELHLRSLTLACTKSTSAATRPQETPKASGTAGLEPLPLALAPSAFCARDSWTTARDVEVTPSPAPRAPAAPAPRAPAAPVPRAGSQSPEHGFLLRVNAVNFSQAVLSAASFVVYFVCF